MQKENGRAKNNLPSSIASRLSTNGGRFCEFFPFNQSNGDTLVMHLTRIEPFLKCDPSRTTCKPRILVTKPCEFIRSS